MKESRAASKQCLGVKKHSKNKKSDQPEARKYKGVFWNSRLEEWMAQKTFPPGHQPRQAYVGKHKNQKTCAELLARTLKCAVNELLMDKKRRSGAKRVEQSDREDGSKPRQYRGVFYNTAKKCWQAQLTHPPGHEPRQETMGSFLTQEAAAKALATRVGHGRTQKMRYKKAEFYKAPMAVEKALRIFQVLHDPWIKKKMIPGVSITRGLFIIQHYGWNYYTKISHP